MNPADLVTPQILTICEKSPIVVVCGFTKSGKITIARKISNHLKRRLFISDDYTIYGPQEAMYVLLKDIVYETNRKHPFIVEGVQCFRLLRKGMQEGGFYPDLIIKTKCDEKTIRHFYNKDGEGHKTDRALSFNKGLDKVWNDYFLKLYLTALIKRQWGQNLIKFQGVKLPGGVEFNGRQLYDDAQREIDILMEKMSNTYELPPFDMIG